MWTYFPELRPGTADDLRALWTRWEAGSPDTSEIWLNWLCREKNSKVLIGSMQATIYPDPQEAYIAYAVYRSHQGNGYAREACKAIIEHISKRYRLKRIYAEMNAQNEPSYRLAESLGFKRIESDDEYLYELVVD
jgi:RimJ/RimL family protein N-acetyltransferase